MERRTFLAQLQPHLLVFCQRGRSPNLRRREVRRKFDQRLLIRLPSRALRFRFQATQFSCAGMDRARPF